MRKLSEIIVEDGIKNKHSYNWVRKASRGIILDVYKRQAQGRAENRRVEVFIFPNAKMIKEAQEQAQ